MNASEPEAPAANPVGGDESQRRRRRLEGDTVAVLIAAATASAQAAWMASYDVNGPRSVGRRGVRSMQDADGSIGSSTRTVTSWSFNPGMAK
jgi:hypothetical protein